MQQTYNIEINNVQIIIHWNYSTHSKKNAACIFSCNSYTFSLLPLTRLTSPLFWNIDWVLSPFSNFDKLWNFKTWLPFQSLHTTKSSISKCSSSRRKMPLELKNSKVFSISVSSFDFSPTKILIRSMDSVFFFFKCPMKSVSKYSKGSLIKWSFLSSLFDNALKSCRKTHCCKFLFSLPENCCEVYAFKDKYTSY